LARSEFWWFFPPALAFKTFGVVEFDISTLERLSPRLVLVASTRLPRNSYFSTLIPMTISDKTRKILWGRSGNRCAICRHKLVLDETELDAESVVGDECHIHSGSARGPRHDSTMDVETIDSLANLLLLCRVHHKMVDDQFETYTADLLRSIKANHEQWVEEKFSERADPQPVRIKRVQHEIPKKLLRINSGAQLFNLAKDCGGTYQDHSDDLNDDEVEIVGGFLQNLRDWVDIASDLEPIDKVRAKKAINDELESLRSSGFLVFAANERQRLEGGSLGPSDFFVLHLAVVRADDPNILNSEQEVTER
jgi:hypothetical protein